MLPDPAGTSPPLPTTVALNERRVETTGIVPPCGQDVRHVGGAGGTTVICKEKARAEGGTSQLLFEMAKLRVALPAIDGPPNGPTAPRVSATRQGMAG